MSGSPIPRWAMWVIAYWPIVVLIIATAGGYVLWLLYKWWAGR